MKENKMEEIEKPILTNDEKTYLESVLKPFKIKTLNITKVTDDIREYIFVEMNGYFGIEYMHLPFFQKGTMYKGMVLGKEYTIKELGLFKDE